MCVYVYACVCVCVVPQMLKAYGLDALWGGAHHRGVTVVTHVWTSLLRDMRPSRLPWFPDSLMMDGALPFLNSLMIEHPHSQIP